MSKYTTELRFICEALAGVSDSGVEDVDKIALDMHKKLFTFPIKNNVATSPWFQQRFIMRYWTREICCYSFGEWKLYLRQALDKDAEKWNALLDTLKEKYSIFENVDITKTGNTQKTVDSSSTNESTQTAASKSTGTSENKYSDTPSGELSEVRNNKYLTSFTAINDTNTGDTNATSRGNNDYKEDNKVDYTEQTKGKANGKTNTEVMVEYRNSLFDIEEQLISSLEHLFFGLW